MAVVVCGASDDLIEVDGDISEEFGARFDNQDGELLAFSGGWDAKLARALEVLGITPKQEKPGWLLCAFYG